MGAELLRHLRIPVILGWLIAWNSLLVLGMWLGGSWDFNSVPARVLLLVVLLATSGLALGIAYSASIQAATLRTRTDIAAVKRDLWFFALITGAGAIATFASFFAEP